MSKQQQEYSPVMGFVNILFIVAFMFFVYNLLVPCKYTIGFFHDICAPVEAGNKLLREWEAQDYGQTETTTQKAQPDCRQPKQRCV